MSLQSFMMRTILKKWYKFQQKQHARKFDSHWYMRFGWLDQPLKNREQLKNLFEMNFLKFIRHANLRLLTVFMPKTMTVILSSLKKLMMYILLAFYLY